MGALALGAGPKLLQKALLGHGRQQDVVYVFQSVLDCCAVEN